MQAWRFEQRVFEIEGIRIVVRAASETEIGEFGYQRCATGTMNLSGWLDTRIKPHVCDFEVVVVNGRGEIYPNGNTHLSTIRDSYNV